MKKILYFLVSLVMITSILPFSALADDLTVIAFGDSITAADKWQKHIEAEYGIDIINAGVGGDTTNSAKARFKKDVLNKNPDIVFISLGVNDCAIDMTRYVDLETYKANMAYFIDECQKIGAKVIVNIPTPVVDEQYLTRHKAEPFEPYGGPNGIVTVCVKGTVTTMLSRVRAVTVPTARLSKGPTLLSTTPPISNVFLVTASPTRTAA